MKPTGPRKRDEAEKHQSPPNFEKEKRPLHYLRRSGESRKPVRQSCVYLLASRRNGTLYVGVTSNLLLRVWQHQRHLVQGFTKRYGVQILVWYEVHATMESAIAREKAIKNWKRA